MQIKVKAEELEMKIEDETYIVTVRTGATLSGVTSLLVRPFTWRICALCLTG